MVFDDSVRALPKSFERFILLVGNEGNDVALIKTVKEVFK